MKKESRKLHIECQIWISGVDRMKYKGRMSIRGGIERSGNDYETYGSGEIESSHESIGRSLASSLPRGIGYAIDSATDLYKFDRRLERED